MRGNAHVRFGGAGRGNGSLERAIPRPGPTLRPAALWRHQPVLGHWVMAPSTLGTFLRAFTFGQVRQLDRLTEQVLPGRGRPASSAHAVLAGG
jgi:hypothetical protein